jgi:FKBP-type peptidyl-prolyl cis-trans isomerase SlyD
MVEMYDQKFMHQVKASQFARRGYGWCEKNSPSAFLHGTFAQTKNEREEIKMIRDGSVVRFEYTLSADNGEIIQSTKGKDPVTYTHGQHEVLPGLEEGLSGMEVNEEKSIRLQPEEAYGPVDAKAFKEVLKSEIPAGALKVGTPLSVQGSEGEEDVIIRVREVKKETVILDFNHPLAGKTLNFNVRVLAIQSGES